MPSKVYIIILNFNGWEDTIECLESILKLTYTNFKIIVIDNHSSDESVKYLKQWAKGDLVLFLNNNLKTFSLPPHYKPIKYNFFSNLKNETTSIKEISNNIDDEPLITFIHTDRNYGYAGGNNIGIKYCLERNDFKYIWLLNNDTIVEKESLFNLVKHQESYKGSNKKLGILGSKLIYYHNPRILQGIGGSFNKFLATSSHIGEGIKEIKFDLPTSFKIDYVIGASMFVRKDFIQDVGLLCEDYFLYYEEIDWAIRASRAGYSIDSCLNSKVYHKEGASIGISHEKKKKSLLSDHYLLKNRIVFTRKFYPKLIFIVYLGLIISIFNRIKRGQFNRIPSIIRSLKIK